MLVGFIFLSFCVDRPCLEDRSRVQMVQRRVLLGLSHILHRDNQDALLHKVQGQNGHGDRESDRQWTDKRTTSCHQRGLYVFNDVLMSFSSSSAALPEDGSVAFTLQSSHGETALVQSMLSSHCSHTVSTTVQGAVHL